MLQRDSQALYDMNGKALGAIAIVDGAPIVLLTKEYWLGVFEEMVYEVGTLTPQPKHDGDPQVYSLGFCHAKQELADEIKRLK